MKKLIFTLILVLSLVCITANAYNPGDVIGSAVYSGLSSYINNVPIQSYVVNDYAVIVAEELENYCCDVVWNGEERTLNITPSASKPAFTAPAVYKTTRATGEWYANVLYTDIKTYINGNLVTSFNINGRTMIVIDDFGKYIGSYEWNSEQHAAKVTIEGKPVREYKPIESRINTIFSNDEFNGAGFNGAYDFNFDGVDEAVSVQIADNRLNVSIGDTSHSAYANEGFIKRVFVFDLLPNDGFKNIAIITEEDYERRGVYRIYRYDGYNLTPYDFNTFNSYHDVYEMSVGEYWVYFPVEYYMDVDENGVLTLQTQTESNGMWSVLRSFAIDDYGVFVEQRREKYEVLPNYTYDYINVFYDDGYGISQEEKDMWTKGWYRARIPYENNGFVLNQGEYYKVLYDDCDYHLYVETQSGRQGVIDLSADRFHDASEMNPTFFFTASYKKR